MSKGLRGLLRLLAGVMGGLGYLALLVQAGVIRFGPMGSVRGWSLVPLLLLAGPAIALLWGRSRPAHALAVTLLLLSAAPLVGSAVDSARAWRSTRAWDLQVAQRQEAADRAARTTFGPGVRAVKIAGGPPGCPGLLVAVEGQEQHGWYWYDEAAGRITGQLTEQRLRQLLGRALPPTATVATAQVGTAPHEIPFTYRLQDAERPATAYLGQECRLVLRMVLFPDHPEPVTLNEAP